jgi:hypothetical protein
MRPLALARRAGDADGMAKPKLVAVLKTKRRWAQISLAKLFVVVTGTSV